MIRFYAPEIESTGQLPEVESGHCCRVLRMREGDIIHVVDGRGNAFECEITDAHQKHTSVSILSKKHEDLHWSPRITLAVAPTKNMDRMEWLIEKAIEIGVNRIVMLDCTRNVRHTVKTDRIEKIMVSAMKQSLKSELPEYAGMVAFDEFVASDDSELKYVGYCNENVVRIDFSHAYDGRKSVTLMIGPEGDFTPEEIDMAIAKCGYQPVTFGNTRLRTETAALYALCAAHTLISRQ